MKVEKLMIGDWVSLFQGNPDGSSCNVQVSYIGEYGEVGIEGCEGYTSANCNLLFPIPLTAEILERNGFENDFYHDECVADYHYVRLEGYSYHEELILIQWCNGKLNVVNELICDVDMYDCYYVHQLQHALRLCEIEKEIKL